MTAVSSQVSIPTYPSSDGEPVAETFVHLYANYKVWEEGETPAVIFEMTSAGTQEQDQSCKKTLYEQLEVQEYWLFDPKGEWIAEKLIGYRLQQDEYISIADSVCRPLNLRLAVEDTLIGFYRLDTGEKLLIPEELSAALTEATTQLEAERQQRIELEAKLARYQEQFGDLETD